MVQSGVKFVIDNAEPLSAALMAAVTGAASDGPWSVDELAKILDLPSSFGLFARDNDRPLGFLLAQCAAGESEIINLAVTPAARRQGIGGALVTRAMARARVEGARKMFLEVADDNVAARVLYDRIGFVQVGIRPDYYLRGPVNYVDALILGIELITTGGN